MTDFDKQSYWRDRFASETEFEWLVPSEDFVSICRPHLSSLSSSARILQLGFGTSDLQCHLRSFGFTDVTNVDYEPTAIQRGRENELKAFGDVKMKYEIADATQLRLDGEGYDLVVDKSTVDAVSCGGDAAFRRMTEGVRSCLRPGGIWISLSYSAWRFDVPDLPFDAEVIAKVPTPKLKPNDPDVFHWCYLLRPRTS
ncbi:methyltransferase domain-containing protein [Sarocladium implicatum]|nr:methyltransferase domain-containing protein [Sarocladium implicatum]